MTPFRLLACAWAVHLAAGVAPAQGQFVLQPDGSFGTRLQATPTSVLPVALGFTFTMPGGTQVTDLDVHATGRLLEVGADGSDNSETVSELLNESPAIAVRWDTNNFPSAVSDIYFATDGASLATVTWAEVQFGTGQPAHAQVQLHADGRIVFVYDSRIANDDGLVGISAGNGVMNPGPSDLSSSIATPITTTEAAVYEDFGFQLGIDDLDLQSTSLEFVPQGVGGSGGWTVVGRSVVDVTPFARVRSGGVGCFSPFTTTFTPDGTGGYDVVSGPSQFDPNLGTTFGAVDDDMITATGVDLGFPFPFPGGAVTTRFVQIDPNGRIIPDSASAVGMFVPGLGAFEMGGHPMICSWTDFNVQEVGADGIYLRTGPGFATFTWNDVPQFGSDFLPLTQQITLRPDGSVEITIQDFQNFNRVPAERDNLLIGLSDGVTTGTPEIDVMTTSVVNTSLAAYEFWRASDGSEPIDFLIEQPTLRASNPPRFGQSWLLQIVDVPAASNSAFLLIGVDPLGVRLDPIGIPCSLSLIEAVGATPLPIMGSTTAQVSIPVSTDPVLRGYSVYVQGVVDGAPFVPFPFFFTNAVVGIVGD